LYTSYEFSVFHVLNLILLVDSFAAYKGICCGFLRRIHRPSSFGKLICLFRY